MEIHRNHCGANFPEGHNRLELFGHEKGSFTGHMKAVRVKDILKLRMVASIFLDEIGELPLGTSKLVYTSIGENGVELFQSRDLRKSLRQTCA